MFSPGNVNESEPSASTTTTFSSSVPCRCFKLPEILLATDDFNESLVIGQGGFGNVYKGTLFIGSDSPVDVAIKRLDSMSTQGAPEFWAEVEMLSKLRHCHLVSLIGYCNHENEMILVYEYLPLGTLADHLHKLGTYIPWIQRLRISIGAARGLEYLHTGAGIVFGIIHRDVKTSNILLHESWAAKISDFGLSRIGPTNQPKTYVNTLVKGTFGYLDPNYFNTGNLTRKSDVYAFGVVLLEVLCRKRAVDRSLDEEQWGLATWAQESIKEGKLKQIVDSGVKGEIAPKCLKDFVGIAQRCLQINPKHRPTMAEVVFSLESVLSLQEKSNGSLQTAGKTIFGRMFNQGTEYGFLMTKKKKRLMLRKKFFEENGGLLLKEVVRPGGGIIEIFLAKELQEATQNYADHMILGFGSNGPVYRGTLVDKRVVAIKRLRIYDQRQMEQYINEIVILGQMQHQNMVRLLGCCLETEDPWLVYEFVSNGTLYDHIFNGTSGTMILSWDRRLRIAHETAGALAYLHTDSQIFKIHGDVKSSKILLDELYTAKIASFGSSMFRTDDDVTRLTTVVQGTLGYLDPEYIITCNVTDKSDVYSFGVVLLELLTRKKAIDMETYEEDNTLATHFVKLKREDRWREILDSQVEEESTDEQLEAVCDLVFRCLDLHRENRPSMKQVTMELETIRNQSYVCV